MDKPFVVFGFDGYYPAGGWNDFIDRFETLDEAREAISRHRARDLYQIIDVRDGTTHSV